MDSIRSLDVLRCDAGWRQYHFLKLTTDDGVVGWSEFDENFGSPGVGTIIEHLGTRLIGHRVTRHQEAVGRLFYATRPAAGGVIGEAIGAIENAMLDAHARTLGVPCHELFGGRLRDRVTVYWSHAPTWRIAHAEHYGNRIVDRADMVALGAEVVERRFRALKTNVFRTSAEGYTGWVPGFGRPYEPGLIAGRAVISELGDQLSALREGAGDAADILLDLNFNLRGGEHLELVRSLDEHDLFWVEIDAANPQALAATRRASRHRIASCETLIGGAALRPYLEASAVDVAIIDGIWNGMWQAMRMAALAEAHEVNVAPHNFYGHLATYMNLHWAAAVPNLEIMEVDVDRLAWDDELFTTVPSYEDGQLVVPDTPGWGCEPIEEALAAYPA